MSNRLLEYSRYITFLVEVFDILGIQSSGVTVERMALIAELGRRTSPPTMQELHKDMDENFNTPYTTLCAHIKLFVDKGIVELYNNPEDTRSKIVIKTSKFKTLEKTLDEYLRIDG